MNRREDRVAGNGTERPRDAVIGRAAVALIAREGLRGLTHRAVDREAGLPPGSTSYYARTRARLLQAAVERMAAEEDEALTAMGPGPGTAPPPDPASVAHLFAGFAHFTITEAAERTLARFELALEATRRPELRRVYDGLGARYRALAEDVLRAVGSEDPARHARSFIAWCDGIAFDSLAGSGAASPPGYDELYRDAEELVGTLFGEQRR
ncbi:TetR/AcrR family transcriptional regulator [Nocardiopsis suaedae]|uniref:TetR family transcriptional regulator C-terminal domain-containing protein n=1 Tax=Nocardiopsis suaedae TaxID=3018444 RepID=A0ABT4TF41_9ACTN|nr:TetR/AcrR family transcriptional regulator [Nocardiopsis suaedae]MDA2803332.1 TetR family transcriptional regulator C-terminal domain-containing protein [Nocardiopsis suaedae]